MLFSELFINALTVEGAGADFNPNPQFKVSVLSPCWLREAGENGEDSENAVKNS